MVCAPQSIFVKYFSNFNCNHHFSHWPVDLANDVYISKFNSQLNSNVNEMPENTEMNHYKTIHQQNQEKQTGNIHM